MLYFLQGTRKGSWPLDWPESPRNINEDPININCPFISISDFQSYEDYTRKHIQFKLELDGTNLTIAFSDYL